MLPIDVILATGSLWAASSAAYYFFLPVLGVDLSYEHAPLQIALFYLAWVGIAIYTFQDLYRDHVPSRQTFRTDMTVSVLLGIVAGLFLWGLSRLAVPTNAALHALSDLFVATPWYFLPKSLDILFQQLLIAALVLALGQRFSLRATAVIYAGLFTAAHLLLFFGGTFSPTTYLMLLGAIASATIFPYLLLRVRHGFLYTYAIHWAFYAAVVVALRLAFL